MKFKRVGREELKKGGYEKEEVKAWKRENKERIENYANALSNFRRHFYAAPMEKAFRAVKSGTLKYDQIRKIS